VGTANSHYGDLLTGAPLRAVLHLALYEPAALLSEETVVKKPYTVEELCAAVTQALGNSDRSASGRKLQ
jgi:hypothetical protein